MTYSKHDLKSNKKPSSYNVSTDFFKRNFSKNQTQSFKWFLTCGLKQVLTQHGFFSTRLEHINISWPYYNATGELITCAFDGMCDIIIHGHAYRLKKPRFSPKQALLKQTTYSSQLFVPVQFIYHPTQEMFMHWVLLANLPLMTKQGHFIVNGSPRMIMNQMVRCPGVYFKKVSKSRTKTLYMADIIAHRGTWLRLEIDTKAKRIWAKMKRLNKISVNHVMSDLGLSAAFFDKRLKTLAPLYEFNVQPIFKNDFAEKAEQMDEFFEDQFHWTRAGIESRAHFFKQRFANPSYYSLSKTGRNQLNQKLGLQLPLSKTTLTGEDILLTCCRLIEFYNGDYKASDIDDLSQRKIRSTGELIQMQIATGLLNLKQTFKENLNQKKDLQENFWKNRLVELQIKKKSKKKPTKLDVNSVYEAKKNFFQNLISSAPINTVLKTFFGTNPLSQFLDQTNPLAQLTHIRRLSSLGDGGINRENATMAMRGIHPSHYGRICPIETPEGQNAGLVNSFTNYAILNTLGTIETPFYKVHEGMVLKDQKPQLFAPLHEKNWVLAPGDTPLDSFNCLPQKKLDVRQAQNVNQFHSKQIHFMSVSPLQMISVATSLIPFLEHDDGNRALMGSNMQRQAVPTLIPDAPIVRTGFESKVIADSSYGIQAKKSGMVTFVDNQYIKVVEPSQENSTVLNTIQTPEKRLFFSYDDSEETTCGKASLLKKSYQRGLIQTVQPRIKNGLQKKHHQRCLKGTLFLNTSQIYQLQEFNLSDEIRNLKYIFSWMMKQLEFKNAFMVSPWLNEFTISVLEKTFNEAYAMHYSMCLIKEFFLDPFPCPDKTKLGSEKTTYLPNLLKRSLKQTQCKTRLTKTSFTGIFNQEKIFFNKDSKLASAKFSGLVELKPVENDLFSNKQTLLLKKRVYPSYTLLKPDLKQQTNCLTPFWVKQDSAHLSSKFTKIRNLNPLKPKQLFLNELKFKTLNQFQLNKFYGTHFKKQNRIKKVSTQLNSSNLYSTSLFTGQLESLKKSFVEFPNLKALNQKFFKSCFKSQDYVLDTFSRSNQDTVMRHKPVVSPGQWVEKRDLLADNLASCNGELSIGQNLMVGYTPWEGYNFEDAVLMSQRTIAEDLFTSIHIERYEISIKDTNYGREQITYRLPPNNTDFKYLDNVGIIPVGSWVEPGDVLVGKVTPIGEKVLTPYEQLLYDIINQSPPELRDTSLRVPANVHGRVIHVEKIPQTQVEVSKQVMSSSANLNSNLKEIKNFKKKRFGSFWKPRFKNQRRKFNFKNLRCKDCNETFFCEKPKAKFNSSLFNLEAFQKKSSWLKQFNLNVVSKIPVNKTRLKTNNFSQSPYQSQPQSNIKTTYKKIKIYIAEQRKIQVGDKIAGRHGNKGIISAILPREDMPYLPDGTILDLVLNPLGVPSRMNVGQIFECLLGLAGNYLNQVYKIQPFDETYGIQASRSLVYSKLYEARLKTNHSWLFNPNTPGKIPLFDGRTGDCFEQPVTVGKAYILKLIHLVDEKIHARSTGPYSLVTQQPLRGRSSQGGQRVGEMEVWAFEGFGAAYILQELLTVKSDDIKNRRNILPSILKKKSIQYGFPESFHLLMSELQCLCLKVVVGKAHPIPLIKQPLFHVHQLSLQAECIDFEKMP